MRVQLALWLQLLIYISQTTCDHNFCNDSCVHILLQRISFQMKHHWHLSYCHIQDIYSDVLLISNSLHASIKLLNPRQSINQKNSILPIFYLLLSLRIVSFRESIKPCFPNLFIISSATIFDPISSKFPPLKERYL